MSEIGIRLANEQRLLAAALPRLAAFVSLHRTAGTPPTTYRLWLQPFGLRVRHRGAEPVAFDPASHGPIELVLTVDPTTYPREPWHARLLCSDDLAVLSPHVGAVAPAQGVVCWLDLSQPYATRAWPVHAVLGQVLRILSGEVYAVEGYALQEDAKLWYVAHRSLLPFARVPVIDVGGPAPAAARPGSRIAAAPGGDGAPGPVFESVLGIEFAPRGER